MNTFLGFAEIFLRMKISAHKVCVFEKNKNFQK